MYWLQNTDLHLPVFFSLMKKGLLLELKTVSSGEKDFVVILFSSGF